MHRWLLIVTAVLAVACKNAPPPRQLESVTGPLGSWQGRNSATLGFVSDSGRFTIKWEAKNESAPKAGRLHLTIHSAVSGRPLQEVVDFRGEGSGTYVYSDDPRSYNIMVDSANVEWSISVEGTSGVYSSAARPQ
jgi:hypothetical protein